VGRRDVKKVQQVFQIALDARDGAGAAMLPAMFPLAIGAQRFAFAAGAVAGGGFGDTAAFLAADLSGDVAHFVRPTELPRDARIDRRQSGAQAFAAIADHQPEIFSLQSAQEQILQELHPGGFAFTLGELVSQDFAPLGSTP
jgi:hypothetical protein